MRKLIFSIVLTAILSMFAVGAKAQSPCDESGTNCGPYKPASTPYTFEFPGCPGCNVTIYYEIMQCENIAFFKLGAISMDFYDPDCKCALDTLLPFGLGGYCEQQVLALIWRRAFEQISLNWFDVMKEAYPNRYNCPNTYTCRTITEGGCASWRYAHKLNTDIVNFVPTPCGPNGCCITERVMCFNTVTQKVEIVSQTTNYNPTTTCDGTSPSYNPFADYDPNIWFIGPASPCMGTCYIWSLPE